MKIKTSELIGPALDWLVAKCEGINEETFMLFYEPTEPNDYDAHLYPEFHYSSVWAQGGPIIEREKLQISPSRSDDTQWNACLLTAWPDNEFKAQVNGPIPLIAAMRAFVASKLGDEVEIPDELK